MLQFGLLMMLVLMPLQMLSGANELELMNRYWLACNYLTVGMIYLKEYPLPRNM